MLTDLEDLLRELMAASHAVSVQIGPEDQPLGEHALKVSLGSGASLVARFAGPEAPGQPQSRTQLVEQSARSLRACRRRHAEEAWPTLGLPQLRSDPRRLILARIQQFLQALVDSSQLYQCVLMCRGQLIASARPMRELDEERLELLSRQLDHASAKTSGSTHGEIARDELYGLSFWYGAALFGFSDAPYSVDFVRHRSKLVVRELAHLLELLDDGPDEPAKEASPP